ncbi:hypothetical protein EVAR_76602_1 [Eumeta japonica]|uniref:Uncharacterized protein n=1 Tax=Eumeta variegata TaxID=151549 RepID=A0A4C1T536_EUMVA|nr:hypothetical protein EVAR_76602_1 [Eumeta japonica]
MPCRGMQRGCAGAHQSRGGRVSGHHAILLLFSNYAKSQVDIRARCQGEPPAPETPRGMRRQLQMPTGDPRPLSVECAPPPTTFRCRRHAGRLRVARHARERFV